MVAPGSNRGKLHSRGRGGGHRATGRLTAGARHAPLEASICKEALGTLQPGLSVPAIAAERDQTVYQESWKLKVSERLSTVGTHSEGGRGPMLSRDRASGPGGLMYSLGRAN